MADNELTVRDAGGTTRGLRSVDLGSGLQGQGIVVWEGPETPAAVAGATLRYTVDNSPAVPLVPPTAGARYARLRVYESSVSGTPDSTLRLYYRQDGVTPLTDGSNAAGFLLHGELILVKLADFTDFKMIAEGTGVFAVYVEWLANP